MANKLSGFIKKNTAKVVATVTTVGTIVLTTVGFNVYNKLNARPQQPIDTTTRGTSYTTVAPDGTFGTTSTSIDIHTVAPPPAISTHNTTNNSTNTTTNSSNSTSTTSNSSVTRPTYSSTTPFDPMATTSTTASTTSTTATPTVPVQTTGSTQTTATTTPAQTSGTTQTTATTTPAQTTGGVAQEPPINNDDNKNEQLNTSIMQVLAKLSNLVNKYFNSEGRKVTDINIIEINPEDTLINIQGVVKINNNFQNFTAVINNNDVELSIYNLDENIDEFDVVDSLNEVLDDENTELSKFQYKTYLKVSDSNAVIKSVIESRIEQLSSLNTDEAKAEIVHLNNILANPNKAHIDFVFNSRTKIKDGYVYSVSAVVNTGKHTIKSTCTLPVSAQLKTDILSQVMEEAIINKTNITTTSVNNSVLDRAFFVVEEAINSMIH